MGALRLNLYSPSGVYDTTIEEVLGGSVITAQIDRFDDHSATLSDVHKDSIEAKKPGTIVEFEEVGVGVVAKGIILNPRHSVDDKGTGQIDLTVANLTEESRRHLTGLGYADSNEMGTVVSNLGALTTKGESFLLGFDATGRAITNAVPGGPTGWSAKFVDDGTLEWTAAAVYWGGAVGCDPYGNSIKKTPGLPAGWNSFATGTPFVTNLTLDASIQWQVVDPAQVLRAGWSTSPSADPNSMTFGFEISGGTWYLREDGVVPTGSGFTTGKYGANALFSITWTHPVGFPGGVIQYAVNGTTIFSSARVPTGVLVPVAHLYSTAAEVANMLVTRIAAQSQAWKEVRYDNMTQVGALTKLAKDTFYHIRQGRDASGVPNRTFEIGSFKPTAGVALPRFVDGRGGDVARIIASKTNKLIRTITVSGPDITNVVTIATPLGGTGGSPVTIDRLWRMISDPTYPSGNIVGAQIGSIFPEYDPNFTIHRVASGVNGYEYYIRNESAALVYGEIATGPTDSQYVYQDRATIADQEATQRGLYVSTIAKMKRAAIAQMILEIETIGTGSPLPGGSWVHVEHVDLGTDAKGVPFVKQQIADDFQIMSTVSTYDEKGVRIDKHTLSNNGKYLPSDDQYAADQQAQMNAIQVVQTNGSDAFAWPTVFRELDAHHDVVVNLKLPATIFRVTEAWIRCDFYPFRQTVTAADGGSHQHDYVIPGHSHGPVSGLATENSAVDLTGHYHAVSFDSKTYNLSSPRGLFWTDSTNSQGQNNRLFRNLFVSNDIAGELKTTTEYLHSADNTPHPHDIKGVDVGGVKKITSATSDVTTQTLQTGAAGNHTHVLKPDVLDGSSPDSIQFHIDSGDGTFVDRSGILNDALTNRVGPYSASFEVEISKYIQSPGRTVRFMFRSVSTSSANPKAQGCVGYSGSFVWERGGLGSRVLLQS